ncbi:hypothetical protein BU16DRAFT_540899 [Lophium mytilinum]|uniref:Uncharacterized protein n=1 Tax=Lophium mytilinum TaxID=390894 RepID=A0A6A6QMG1_9PEZI|nr:hypothetical protein BU16DRAFT_540899 [Lophium mytilinum]
MMPTFPLLALRPQTAKLLQHVRNLPTEVRLMILDQIYISDRPISGGSFALYRALLYHPDAEILNRAHKTFYGSNVFLVKQRKLHSVIRHVFRRSDAPWIRWLLYERRTFRFASEFLLGPLLLDMPSYYVRSQIRRLELNLAGLHTELCTASLVKDLGTYGFKSLESLKLVLPDLWDDSQLAMFIRIIQNCDIHLDTKRKPKSVEVVINSAKVSPDARRGGGKAICKQLTSGSSV